MTNAVLASYTNGNINVTLLEDGTKERSYTGIPSPIHPESVDIKITDYCDMSCAFCHEDSTVEGKHADWDTLTSYVAGYRPGTELAIGGGNPLAYPQLEEFLIYCKKRELICNITINQGHVNRYKAIIKNLIERKLVYGVGISGITYQTDLHDITSNIVYHVIIGVHDIRKVEKLPKGAKILVLGYKNHRRGKEYYSNDCNLVEENKREWFRSIPKLFNNFHVSFDNLAITQLSLARFFTQEEWDTFYMGNDGEFTMYADLVNKQFATSSTSNSRFRISSPEEDFKLIQSLVKTKQPKRKLGMDGKGPIVHYNIVLTNPNSPSKSKITGIPDISKIEELLISLITAVPDFTQIDVIPVYEEDVN